MKRVATLTTLLATALGGAAAFAAGDKAQEAQELKAPEASIPFANMRASIRDWEADGIDGMWVQDARRQWYHARFIGPCHGIDFATQVGFDVRGTSTLDRFATVVVPEHGRCAIQTFTKSEAPPTRKQREAAKAD